MCQPKQSASLRASPRKCSPSFWMMHLTIFSTVSSFSSSSSSEKRKRGTEGWDSDTQLASPSPGAATVDREVREALRPPSRREAPGEHQFPCPGKEMAKTAAMCAGRGGLCCSFRTGEHRVKQVGSRFQIS